MKQFFQDRLIMLGLGKTIELLPRLLVLLACYSMVAIAIYLSANLGQWSPSAEAPGKIMLLSVGFFFLPSLAEELLWRWIMIPPRCLGRIDWRSLRTIAVTSVVFTAAHPVAGTLFVPQAKEYFLQPAFLAIVCLLGLTCGTAYVLSKSIWPSVVIHWITVLAWKFLLGGPFVLLGR